MSNNWVFNTGFSNIDACTTYKNDKYLAPAIKEKTGIDSLCPFKKVTQAGAMYLFFKFSILY